MRSALLWMTSLGIFLSACALQRGSENVEADHFQPPKAATATLAYTATVPVVEMQPSSTPPCSDGLTFVEDISIPDGTIVFP
ncbi:MAG: hypothetical protein IZT55_04110, partial [Anaerolineae bacterium]|nr:hypothetical protein [Anaerolineae bacterium]